MGTQAQLVGYLATHQLKNFVLQTLIVESEALRGNPLGDPIRRAHPVLIPNAPVPKDGFPVVLVLAGFTGNGPNYLNVKTFEPNFAQTLDDAVSRGEAPNAIFVLIDAMTFWGGSQFVDSAGTGNYETFVARDTFDAIKGQLPARKDPAGWCVTGGSSGGYGALHLASKYPEKFGLCAAIAADSFFEANLLPEIWTALAQMQKIGGVVGVKAELKSGKLMKRRESHTILNAIAMGLCYAPDENGSVKWPIDESLGTLREDIWVEWKAHDPLTFLPQRLGNLRALSGIFLDCGNKDQFQLQYGMRQIREILSKASVQHEYSEFDGNHFDISERRPQVWRWLTLAWRS